MVLSFLKANLVIGLYHYCGLQSKRPQVITYPSQNVPELVKNVPKNRSKRPHGKNVGQNVPKMIFLILYFMYFRHNLGCLNETSLDKVFLSRFHSVFFFSKIALRMQFSDKSSIHDPSNITLLYPLVFDGLLCGNYQTIAMILSLR